MPPKAKAKGKARAKQAARLRMPRPAARGGALRRPAAAVANPGPAPGLLRDLSLEKLRKLKVIHLVEAGYYHRKIEVVLEVKHVWLDGGQPFLDGVVLGTRDDGFLRAMTGRSSRQVTIHVCEDGCQQILTEENLVHGNGFFEVDPKSEAWFTNMVEVRPEGGNDELAELRRRARLEAAPEGMGEEESPKEGKKSKKEKKAAKKKNKEEKKEGKERKRKAEVESSEELLETGQKSLRAIYEGTGLDPDFKARTRLLGKAKKIGRNKKKKKKKDSDSGTGADDVSTSSLSSLVEEDVGLFEEEKRMMVIWRRYPGALGASAVREATNHLMSASGTMWNTDKKSIQPVFVHYARQCLIPNMSPPMAQEALSVAMGLDLMIQGKIAATVDLFSQRLKALERACRGSHWTVSRQLELVRLDGMMISEEAETRAAAKRAREEEKLKSLVTGHGGSRPSGYQNTPKGGKGGKDWKGNGKGKQDDRRKGGDKNKHEGKTEWQRKDKPPQWCLLSCRILCHFQLLQQQRPWNERREAKGRCQHKSESFQEGRQKRVRRSSIVSKRGEEKKKEVRSVSKVSLQVRSIDWLHRQCMMQNFSKGGVPPKDRHPPMSFGL